MASAASELSPLLPASLIPIPSNIKNRGWKFNDIRVPGDEFIGREDILLRLKEAFLTPEEEESQSPSLTLKKFSLCGPEGFGKTTTALKFAVNSWGEFSFIWFINCSTINELTRGYKFPPRKFGLAALPTDSSDEVNGTLGQLVNETHRVLESGDHEKPWLLIFDKFDCLEVSFDLPRHGVCVLVTSCRKGALGSRFYDIDLPQLTITDSKKLLDWHGARGSESDIYELIDLLGGHPVIIRQIAYILMLPRQNAGKYLQILRDFGIPKTFAIERCDQNYLDLMKANWKFIKRRLSPLEVDWHKYVASVKGASTSDKAKGEWLSKRSIDKAKYDSLGNRVMLSLFDFSTIEQYNETISMQPLQARAIREFEANESST